MLAWGPALTCLMAGAACLIPPPLEPEPEQVNRPPRILPDNLSPAPTELPVFLPEACPDQGALFEAVLTDDDGDTLYARVFVDYATATANREPEPTVLQTEPNTGVSFQFSPNRLSYVGTNNPHTVELFVADRPFRDDAAEIEGRALTDEQGLTDSFVWTVVLDPGSNLQCAVP